MDGVLRAWGDLLFIANEAFFALIFIVVAARTLRERRRSDVDAALFFGAVAVLLALPRIAAFLDVPDASRLDVITPLILAVPYLLLRLVGDFHTVPGWAMRVADAAFVSLLVAFLWNGSLPVAVVALYAAGPFAWSSVAFLRGARNGRGVAGRRNGAVAIGNAAAVATLAVAAVTVTLAGGEITPVAFIVMQLGILAVGIAYFVGFAPPAWLRSLWRDTDLRSFVTRTRDLLRIPDHDALVRELALAAGDALGFDGALIGLRVGSDGMRFMGTGPGYEAKLYETFGGRAISEGRAIVSFDPIREVPARAQLYRESGVKMLVAAPIRSANEVIGALTTRSRHASLFASDDLEVVQLLADQAGLVLEDRALIEAHEYQTEHDRLTGLLDARALYRRIEEAAVAAPRQLALLLVDLDAFAEVNQTFGHLVGDQLLIEIARRLTGCAPQGSLVARWSGVRFAVLLPGATLAPAEAVARELLSAFERPFVLGQEQIECGATIGVAVLPDHAADARELAAAADVALGVAKRAGNTYATSPLETQPTSARRLGLRADLRRAIGDGSIRVEYQPLVSMRSGGLLRLEALARWDHAQWGVVPPCDFIDLAERTGLIRPLTYRILTQALADARAWRSSQPRLRVAVNLSARMFADAGLIDWIVTAAAREGCPLDALSLEITESVLMTEPERARQTIEKLFELGITTEIDDFGIGYSSLAYLQHLPVSGLKMDKQFVTAMAADERSDSIVRATVGLAHELGFEVVAEGIEDRKHWELLAASGCDVGQGFYVGTPMRAGEVLGWLETWVGRCISRARPAVVRSAADRGKRLILVVDDDPAMVSVVRDVLTDHGYAVATASDGEEALDLVAESRPEAVLLDVHMPLVNGPAFARSLRDRAIDLPIVVMTAGHNAERWAERLDAQAHLAKPFAVDQLLDVTRRVTGGAQTLMA